MRASSMRWHRLLAVCALLVLSIHLLYVLRLNQLTSSHRGSLPSPKKSKLDHLKLGPAAGSGLPNRLQCEGSKALNRTHLHSPPSEGNAAGLETSFVTVFTVYNATSADSRADSGMVSVGNASYSKTQLALSIMNVFVKFIEIVMPRSNVFILTDPASTFHLQSDRVHIYPISGDYDRNSLMLQRIKSYIAFLDARLLHLQLNPNHKQNYIFTDSDIAVVGDLGSLFTDYSDFDVALTFRNNKNQPLNSGFIAVRGTHGAMSRAKIFLNEVLQVYSLKFINASRMLGDQLSLAWVVKSHINMEGRKFSKSETFLEKVGNAQVLFLPCLMYNWTPPEGAGQFHGMPLDVKVVHFKGSRKRLMLESWNFFNSTFDIDDMLCLVLMSGRTKYDF